MKKIKALSYFIPSILLMFFASPALAQNATTIADIANNLIPQLRTEGGVVDLLAAISYLSGIGLGIKGILKLKEHSESKGQIGLSTPIFLLVAASMFMALPSFLNTGVSTFGFNKAAERGFNY
jgi:hypothetical protein